MERWEYKVIHETIPDYQLERTLGEKLNTLGACGWEIVHFETARKKDTLYDIEVTAVLKKRSS